MYTNTNLPLSIFCFSFPHSSFHRVLSTGPLFSGSFPQVLSTVYGSACCFSQGSIHRVLSIRSFLHGSFYTVLFTGPFNMVLYTQFLSTGSSAHGPFQIVLSTGYLPQGPFHRVLSTWSILPSPFHTVFFTESSLQCSQSFPQGSIHRVLAKGYLLQCPCQKVLSIGLLLHVFFFLVHSSFYTVLFGFSQGLQKWSFQHGTFKFQHDPFYMVPFHTVLFTGSILQGPFDIILSKQSLPNSSFYRVLFTGSFQHGTFNMVLSTWSLSIQSFSQGPYDKVLSTYSFPNRPFNRALSTGFFLQVLCFNMFLSKKCFPQGPFLALFCAAWKFFSILYSLPFPVFPSTLRDQHL